MKPEPIPVQLPSEPIHAIGITELVKVNAYLDDEEVLKIANKVVELLTKQRSEGE